LRGLLLSVYRLLVGCRWNCMQDVEREYFKV
jgi:hypothetical protein